MLKGIALFALCFVAVLAALIVLQPSSQESALDALASAESMLQGVKPSAAPAKLDDVRKILAGLRLPPQSRGERDRAVTAIDEAKAAFGTDQTRLSSAMVEIRAKITQAKSNLTASTAMERARGIRDQLLILVWPLVVATLVLYSINSKSSRELLAQVGSVISNVKIPGGLEIAFAGSAVKRNQESVVRSYRQQVIAQYDAVAAQYKISETVNRIVKDYLPKFFAEHKLHLDLPNFRCTIHVKDILFQNSVYQLIDYLPRKWIDSGKGGRGRAWSVRYGVVGRCWRREKSEALGKVTTIEQDLIEDWGMTKDEAEIAPKRQTLFCCLIQGKDKSPLAIFYLDAIPEHAFGSDEQMAALMKFITDTVTELGLDEALNNVWLQVQTSAPLIEIYADRK